jgi:hypothetical protein
MAKVTPGVWRLANNLAVRAEAGAGPFAAGDTAARDARAANAFSLAAVGPAATAASQMYQHTFQKAPPTGGITPYP